MNFEYKIPEEGMDRMGRLDVDGGTIYAMAQWYPRVAVFDDVVGWNTEPYLGAGEFYLEYGDFDYEVTVPYDHIVVGSGVLENPRDVLTSTQRERMEKAAKSDSTVFIITPEEMGQADSRPTSSGKLTWHFKMKNTRDVAFASSKAFIWDAARINLPDGKKQCHNRFILRKAMVTKAGHVLPNIPKRLLNFIQKLLSFSVCQCDQRGGQCERNGISRHELL